MQGPCGATMVYAHSSCHIIYFAAAKQHQISRPFRLAWCLFDATTQYGIGLLPESCRYTITVIRLFILLYVSIQAWVYTYSSIPFTDFDTSVIYNIILKVKVQSIDARRAESTSEKPTKRAHRFHKCTPPATHTHTKTLCFRPLLTTEPPTLQSSAAACTSSG